MMRGKLLQLRHHIKTDYDIELSQKLTKMSENKIFLTYGTVGVSIAREDLIRKGNMESINLSLS